MSLIAKNARPYFEAEAQTDCVLEGNDLTGSWTLLFGFPYQKNMYSKKLLDEFRKYGAVTCSVCKKRKRKNWNIYSANTFCSQECAGKWINKTLSKI